MFPLLVYSWEATEPEQERGEQVSSMTIDQESGANMPRWQDELETRNEAAERLRTVAYGTDILGEAEYQRDIDKALAAERRATVERIRAALLRDIDGADWNPTAEAVYAILDEEAAR